MLSKHRLEHLYTTCNMTVYEIAAKHGLNPRTVSNWLHVYNIPVRRGGGRLGEKHHNWRGGITALYKTIRQCAVYLAWRKAILDRDVHCVLCESILNLEVDHIKPFSVLLKEHNITSRQEAIACTDLWDIANGRTLCQECHRKTDTFGIKVLDM